MELSEKLQALRRQHRMTQAQLAEKLYVSRTAVSKWESGRGTPNLESLKCLSRVFGVSIDELLSDEEPAAQAPPAARPPKGCAAAGCWLDISAVAFILLPLYGNPVNGHVRAVNLPAFTAASAPIRAAYWLLFAMLIALGAAGLLLARPGRQQARLALCARLSLALHAAAILLFAAAREPYVVALLFLSFLAKLLLARQGRAAHETDNNGNEGDGGGVF